MADPFLDDGCTGFVDGLRDLSWRVCCDAHDEAFRTGMTWADFFAANRALRDCVMHSADKIGPVWWIGPVAFIMWCAVGSPIGAWFFRFGPGKTPQRDGTTEGRAPH